MRTWLISLAAAATLSLIGQPGVAAEKTVAQTLRDLDLLGTWSNACELRHSTALTILYEALPDGRVRQSQSYPGSPPNVYVIDTLKAASPERVVFVSTFERTGQRTEAELIRKDGRIRIMNARNMGEDRPRVVDGVIVAAERETLWDSRCED